VHGPTILCCSPIVPRASLREPQSARVESRAAGGLRDGWIRGEAATTVDTHPNCCDTLFPDANGGGGIVVGSVRESLLDSSRSRLEHSESVARAERLVYLKLMEKYQNSDPFKFIIYAARAGEHIPQMTVGK
jgi:hypothetical protein